MSGYDLMSVVELKDYLKSLGYKVSGKRFDLIERLEKSGIKPPLKYQIKRYKILPEFDIFSRNRKYFRGKTANLKFYPHLFDIETSFSLYQHILDYLEVPKGIVKRFNRTYGNDGLVYKIEFGGYGGRPKKIVERVAMKWSKIPFLAKLRDIIQEITSSVFTYCVVQFYPSGSFGIKPHMDKEMIPGSVIAGLSLGQNRILRMSKKNKRHIDIDLLSGSLYVLYPPMNDFWTHSILPDDSSHPRISLTFRTLI